MPPGFAGQEHVSPYSTVGLRYDSMALVWLVQQWLHQPTEVNPNLPKPLPAAACRRRQSRSRLGETLVHEQLDFYSSVFGAPLARSIVSYRIGFAISIGRNNPSERYVVILDQITNHRIGTTLAQDAIPGNAPGGIGIA